MYGPMTLFSRSFRLGAPPPPLRLRRIGTSPASAWEEIEKAARLGVRLERGLVVVAGQVDCDSADSTSGSSSLASSLFSGSGGAT